MAAEEHTPHPKLNRAASHFALCQRWVLLTLALLAGWVALGGDVGLREAGLVLVCIGLNEMRVRLRLERSAIFMSLYWTSLFLIVPLLYLDGDDLGAELLSQGELDDDLLRLLVVALAFPFQSFAAYLTAMPRAQHLVHAFVLVEAVLGVQQAEELTLWPALLGMVALISLSMLLSTVQASALERLGAQEPADPRAPIPAFARRRSLPAALAPAVLACLIALTGFVLLPRFRTDHAIAWATDPDSAASDLTDNPKREPASTRKPRTDLPTPRGSGQGDMEFTSGFSRAMQRVSGLSKGVVLGDEVGEIYKDPTVIAQAELRAPDGQALPAEFLLQSPLLKGHTLEHFDGRAWDGGRERRSRTFPVDSDFSDNYRNEISKQGPPITLTMRWMEDAAGSSSDTANTLYIPGALESITKVTDHDGDSMEPAVYYLPSREQYSLLPGREQIGSVTIKALPLLGHTHDDERDRKLSPSRQAELTSLPPQLSERLESDWSELQSLRRESDPYDQAKQLEVWFRSPQNSRYSLDERPESNDLMGDFICDKDSRVGHCEYFASAMAVGLRKLGTPARLASGLSPNERVGLNDINESEEDESSSSWILRASSAHAWVEAYFPDRGWVSFNPTPPAGTRTDMLSGRLADVEERKESEQELEDVEPVKLAPEDQAEEEPTSFAAWRNGVMDWLDQSTAGIRGFFAKLFQGSGKNIAIVAAVLLLIGGATVMALRRKRWFKRSGSSTKRAAESRSQVRAAAEGLYSELEQALIRLGFRRPPHLTPLEFAQVVNSRAAGQLPSALDATVMYYDLRYRLNQHELSLDDAKQQLAQLSRAVAALEAQAAKLEALREEGKPDEDQQGDDQSSRRPSI